MLLLGTSLASPFGRKVRIASHVASLADRVRIEIADTTPCRARGDAHRRDHAGVRRDRTCLKLPFDG